MPSKRPLAALFVVIGLLAIGCLVALFLWFTTRPPRTNLFVVVGGDADEVTEDQIRAGLLSFFEDLGFMVSGSDGEAVRTTDPDVAIKAAADADAAYVALVTINVIDEGAARVPQNHAIELRTQILSTIGDEPSRPEVALFRETGDDLSTVFADARDRWLATAFATLTAPLFSRPTLAGELVHPGEARDTDAILKVRRRSEAIEAQRLAVRQLEAQCSAEVRDVPAEDHVLCRAAGCRDQDLVGVTDDGRSALVVLGPPRRLVPFEERPRVQELGSMKSLALLPLEGGEFTVVRHLPAGWHGIDLAPEERQRLLGAGLPPARDFRVTEEAYEEEPSEEFLELEPLRYLRFQYLDDPSSQLVLEDPDYHIDHVVGVVEREDIHLLGESIDSGERAFGTWRPGIESIDWSSIPYRVLQITTFRGGRVLGLDTHDVVLVELDRVAHRWRPITSSRFGFSSMPIEAPSGRFIFWRESERDGSLICFLRDRPM